MHFCYIGSDAVESPPCFQDSISPVRHGGLGVRCVCWGARCSVLLVLLLRSLGVVVVGGRGVRCCGCWNRPSQATLDFNWPCKLVHTRFGPSWFDVNEDCPPTCLALIGVIANAKLQKSMMSDELDNNSDSNTDKGNNARSSSGACSIENQDTVSKNGCVCLLHAPPPLPS